VTIGRPHFQIVYCGGKRFPARVEFVLGRGRGLAPATFHVTNQLGDASAGKLRYAIILAKANPGPDTIDFQGIGPIITFNGSQLPAFTNAATTMLTGPSCGVTLDAQAASRIFLVEAGAAGALP
jgi:hypothetical protein